MNKPFTRERYKLKCKLWLVWKRGEEEGERGRFTCLLGVAVWVEPASGSLQPYEEINVKVVCYGDMCGTYEDILLFQAEGLAPLLFLVKVDVQGSPLVIWRNSMGLGIPFYIHAIR
jgi:hypothetical protein